MITPSLPTRSSAADKQVADRGIVVGRNRTDVCDFLLVFDRASHLNQMLGGRGNRLVDAATDRGRIAAGNDVSQTFFEDRSSQHGRGRRSVASQVARFLCDFDDQLRTHVLESVFQFDFLGHRYAVFGDRWAAERFVDDHVATGRPIVIATASASLSTPANMRARA